VNDALLALAGASVSATVILSLLFRLSRKDLDSARVQLAVANERLVQARRDGLLIPTVEDVAPAATPEAPALTKDLQALIDDWESPAAREAQRRMIHELLNQGVSPAEAYRRLAPQPV
jgi:hypothetical protein